MGVLLVATLGRAHTGDCGLLPSCRDFREKLCHLCLRNVQQPAGAFVSCLLGVCLLFCSATRARSQPGHAKEARWQCRNERCGHSSVSRRAALPPSRLIHRLATSSRGGKALHSLARRFARCPCPAGTRASAPHAAADTRPRPPPSTRPQSDPSSRFHTSALCAPPRASPWPCGVSKLTRVAFLLPGCCGGGIVDW
jgi:hypothetical protein